MITVLMGAPASGKTTWLKENKTGFEHIYSTELVRVNRELDVDYYMSMIRAKAVKAADEGKDVIADGTHTITLHRLFWLNLAKRLSIETRLIVFNTPLPLLLMGNSIRSHPCPVNVLVKHHKNMQIAKRLVLREAWNTIENKVRNV